MSHGGTFAARGGLCPFRCLALLRGTLPQHQRQLIVHRAALYPITRALGRGLLRCGPARARLQLYSFCLYYHVP